MERKKLLQKKILEHLPKEKDKGAHIWKDPSSNNEKQQKQKTTTKNTPLWYLRTPRQTLKSFPSYE